VLSLLDALITAALAVLIFRRKSAQLSSWLASLVLPREGLTLSFLYQSIKTS
jgi:hypothetical protein